MTNCRNEYVSVFCALNIALKPLPGDSQDSPHSPSPPPRTMSISTLRRQVKNVAYNFSDAQVKVREATSNDPWGPTTALMSEIADLTHNPIIETLKDFQHIEDNRDQGLNVREKAKQMVALLQDEERLKNERARFLLTRKRFIQNGSGISSEGATRNIRRPHADTGVADSELDEARPSSLGEEEMQLQIAMALSREECEKEEEMRKGDAIRLQIALEESKREAAKAEATNAGQNIISSSALTQSALDDLLSLGLGEPINASQAPSTSAQAYGTSTSASSVIDPWSPRASNSQSNPQIYPSLTSSASLNSTTPMPSALTNAVISSNGGTSAWNDPWAPSPPTVQPMTQSSTSTTQQVPLDLLTGGPPVPSAQSDPWAAFELQSNNVPSASIDQSSKSNLNGNSPPISDATATLGGQLVGQQRPNVKTPDTFLGENSSLVNLDNLMGPSTTQVSKPASNPFMLGSSSTAAAPNPFAAQQRPSPSLHEMMQAKSSGSASAPTNDQSTSGRTSTNPFAI
ncbi:ENTH domain-containing protein [Ditylenchus destructor]|uniref:ENTH domain-containing protein n=1 Tax=Ditylenchus destructor TaxID=166010 RepID=A0AAD4R6J1_9BILA|nr:ENTH domain-containing protein [Ditylenchus destructor]